MATYMYKSKTSKNWDDDDDDFDLTVYEGAAAEFGTADKAKSTLSNARLALQELEKQSASEYEQEQDSTPSTTVITTPSKVDYKKIDEQYWPSAAGCATRKWFRSDPPAYPALSNDSGFAYPYDRRSYNKNWLATKLWMGANMKHTTMMAPSNLHLSKIWVSDSLGEYIQERGYEYFPHLSLPSPHASTPRLFTDFESGDEQDEARTPPDTPSLAKVSKCEVEEYDPTTGAIDLPAYNIKSMEAVTAGEFANFSSIAEGLTADQILGDTGENLLNATINEDAIRMLVGNMKAHSVVRVTTTSVRAIIATPTLADEAVEIAPAASRQLVDGKNDSNIVPADSATFVKVPTPLARKHSPDLKYIVDPTNTSLVWNTVAAGWFALFSLPWGRMAVAAAGALVDFAVFLARH